MLVYFVTFIFFKKKRIDNISYDCQSVSFIYSINMSKQAIEVIHN